MYGFKANTSRTTTDATTPAAYSCAPVALSLSIAVIAMLIFVMVRITMLAVLHIIVLLPIVGLMLIVKKIEPLKARPKGFLAPA